MKRIALLLVFAIGLTVPLLQAQIKDLRITATRSKLDESRSRSSNTTTTTKEIAYDITVASKSFDTFPKLDVKYMLFYVDTTPGSTDKSRLASVQGSKVITNFASHGKAEVQTKPIKLSTETLDAGWYYANGSGNRSKDRVKGLWVRVYADGKLVGEYVNPSSIKRKYDWKE